MELPATSAGSVEEESIARQTAQVVERALAALTPARREAFILLRYEGLSVAAAAQVVGISEGALEIRAFHAYEALRSALAEMHDASGADSGWRSALVGGALGLLSGAAINLHCPNVDPGHMLAGHGVPVLAAALFGALVVARWARA